MKISTLFERIEKVRVVRAIRTGLANLIPVLIVGAFALILKTFPVPGYQNFITNQLGGVLLSLFDFVYAATFGVLAVYMTFSISRAYVRLSPDPDTITFGAVFSALVAFFIMAGANLETFGIDSMGPKSMFLALIAGLGATALYLKFEQLLRNRRHVLLTSGADRDFNRMIRTIVPIALVAIIFALINLILTRVSGEDSIRSLLSKIFNWLFSFGNTGFFKGFFFVLLSSVLWFFGIHGSDTLEDVMQNVFVPGLEINQAAVAAGNAPTEILTKQFFDCFVLMGGCGSTICLLIAILIISRNRARRSLGYVAAFPMLFNINELMVFGLPIIFNPVMLIPFLTVPLVCYSVAYLAMALGWVPLITGAVEWTTPIILGGFHATGSVAGSILQVVNVILGVAIYMPFIRILDKQTETMERETYASFVKYFKENEQTFAARHLTDLNNIYGAFAKSLCADLRQGMKKNMVLAYQPQYNYDGSCIGVEALLRWSHPVHGVLYPPLLVKLAQEGNFLEAFEEAVFEKAMEDRPAILERFGPDVKLSINVTGTTVTTPQFQQFCKSLAPAGQDLKDCNICVEVTEQAALMLNEEGLDALRNLKSLGMMLAIDDFSMGQTSLHYLKDELFDIIKLDGSLVRGLSVHQSYKEIISSMSTLAASLNMTVLAEFVETEEQRNILHSVGCDNYQGFLYSKAVFLDDTRKNTYD
ncbi:MAG: PTS sugar transporter subunit IIC/EAL domain-containing protein [Clostridia bacterium]|nr:PTS sugar transporter subunit IIC/EAL domain-containing protein [Clostridia bacterium]